MKKFEHFLLYNNTIPLLFGVLFLGAGATFAASPEARGAVVSSQSVLASVDNSYLLTSTITDSTVEIFINSISENSETYFVEYQLTTIDVQDGVIQPVTKTKVFEVQKSTIIGQDLGLYISTELGEAHAGEVKKLKEEQSRERMNGITPKVVATKYSGLVGQFLDPDLETFSDYDPVIPYVPLTSEQEAAHRAERKRIEEEKKAFTITTNDGTRVTVPQIGQDATSNTGSSTQDTSGNEPPLTPPDSVLVEPVPEPSVQQESPATSSI